MSVESSSPGPDSQQQQQQQQQLGDGDDEDGEARFGVSRQWRTAALRLASMVIGCIAVGMSYLVNAFNIFALPLKKQFSLNQTQLELLLSMLFLGMCASLPGGLLVDKLGSYWGALVALVVSVIGYLLLWGSTWYPIFYNENVWLLAVFFLFAGIGNGLTYITATSANIRNYGEKMRGTIVGIMHASLSVGPAIVMVVYNSFFVNGHEMDIENQNIGGFFIFLTVSFACVNLLGMCLYGYYPPREDNETKGLLGHSHRQGETGRGKNYHELSLTCSVHVTQSHTGEKSKWQMLLTKEFHFLFWPCIILLSLQMMFVQNITTILESVNYSEYNSLFPYITPILGTLAKPSIGFFSDITTKWVPRSGYIFIGCLLDVITWTLCIFLVYNIAVILFATTACDFAAFSILSLAPPIFIERFGMEKFPFTWGLVMGGFATLTAGLVSIFGAVYDSQISISAENCYGPRCFETSFIVSAVISLLAVLCMFAYCALEREEMRQTQLKLNLSNGSDVTI